MGTDAKERNFLATLQQHQGILHKVCKLYSRNRNDYEDLFQEMVLQLWRSFDSFRNESKISTWMYRIALNTAISGFRKKQIVQTELDPQLFRIADDPAPQADEELQWLYRSIETLSEIEKAIVLLYLEDRPYEEIAEITGITANYVAVKMNRIKEKLRKLVKSTDDGRTG